MRRFPLLFCIVAACGGEVSHTSVPDAPDLTVDDTPDVETDTPDAADTGGDADTLDAGADAVGADVAPPRTEIAPERALPARPSTQECLPAAGTDEFEMPRSILETGCFDLATFEPTDELIPYEVNAPLWTDGAAKYRYLVVPPEERIEAAGAAPWTFPAGSVLVKTFSFEFETESGIVERPVETRFMVLRPFGWQFFTYAWNEEATDALLLGDQAFRSLETTIGAVEYLYPDEESCRYCHSGTAELVLGPRTGQLDRWVEYDEGWARQTDVFAALELVALDAAEVPVWPDPLDTTAPLEDRARSYLATNCAHCHQPGGWQPPPMTLDLRYELPLEDTQLCDPIQYISPLVPGLDRLVPGEPESSNVYNRIVHRGLGSMPPLAVSLIDDAGAAVVEEWIRSLVSCP